jgi:IS5 family transposase
MDRMVPWQPLIDLIQPPTTIQAPKETAFHFYDAMLRNQLMQQWYSLSDQAMEDALIEMHKINLSC